MSNISHLRNTTTGIVYEAHSIGAADTLEQSERWNAKKPRGFHNTPEWTAQVQEVDSCWQRNRGDGFWIEGVGRVVVGPPEPWENLFTPFDKMGREICVGDVVMYAMVGGTVSELKVEKIGIIAGYERTLHGTDIHTGRKNRTSHPSRCFKVSP